METEKFELKEDSMLWIKDIKDVLQDLYNQFRAVQQRNKYLEEANKILQTEQYKDEELARMKKDYDQMRDDYYRGFPISKEEMERIHKWMDEIIGNGPDMKINSARFYYKFYPTAIGVSGEVIDSISGQKFEFQEIG